MRKSYTVLKSLLLASTIAALTTAPTTISAQEVTIDNITYEVSDDGEYAVLRDGTYLVVDTLVIPSDVVIDGYSYEVKELGYPGFMRLMCSSLTLPNTIEVIDGLFSHANIGEKLVVPEKVKALPPSFLVYAKVNTVYLQSNIEVVQQCTLYADVDDFKVYIEATTPPFIETYWDEDLVLETTPSTLYVPIGCKEDYEIADGWRHFDNIIEVDYTAVKQVETADVKLYFQANNLVIVGATPNTIAIVYGLDGIKKASFTTQADKTTYNTPNLPKGIYIVTIGSTAHKLIK